MTSAASNFLPDVTAACAVSARHSCDAAAVRSFTLSTHSFTLSCCGQRLSPWTMPHDPEIFRNEELQKWRHCDAERILLVKTQNPGSMKACASSPSGKHPEALRTQAGHLREVRKVQGLGPDDLKRPARRVPTDTTRQMPGGRCCWRSVAAATSVAGRWWRSVKISARSDARDRNNPISANQISLQTSPINQEHRPIRSLASRIEFPMVTLAYCRAYWLNGNRPPAPAIFRPMTALGSVAQRTACCWPYQHQDPPLWWTNAR